VTDRTPEISSDRLPAPPVATALYDGQALISDPIHGYISFTIPTRSGGSETTEKELIDSAWMQRLRYIYQLQSARWVYPSAEHSRFQHSLGAMHVGGRFARHLYPSLRAAAPDCPSLPYIEALLRTAALLHDVGHGPFGHFFDEHYLESFHLTHELVGQQIILQQLGDLIRNIRRSPSGPLAPDETLMPEQLAFLILKDPKKDSSKWPRWLVMLQPVLGGIYTADNLDYVLRDAYMCGVAVGPVDLDRLLYYTFFTRDGLTLHRAGLGALQMFLTTRWYLYSNVYYHRTTRAIDLHLREIFKETIGLCCEHHPGQALEPYLGLTDWFLLEEVRRWQTAKSGQKRKLAQEWQRLLGRDVKWKMAYEMTLPTRGEERGRVFMGDAQVEAGIRAHLPSHLQDLPFRVDLANQDPRPLNPFNMGEFQIYVHDPSTGANSKEPLRTLFDFIPAKVVQCRVFSLDHGADAELAKAAERVLANERPSSPTNL
jgi:HD superfamily phosphohydrolase